MAKPCPLYAYTVAFSLGKHVIVCFDIYNTMNVKHHHVNAAIIGMMRDNIIINNEDFLHKAKSMDSQRLSTYVNSCNWSLLLKMT